LRWQVINVPAGNPLTDLLQRQPEVARSLLPPNPEEEAGQETARQRLQEYPGHRRRELALVLRERHRRLGAPAACIASCRKLEDPTCAVVVGGQQAGAWGGPLYTVYKALSTIAWAHLWEVRWGVTCVPAFWMATEDHDYREAASFAYVDEGHRLQRLMVGDPPPEPHCVGTLPVPGSALALLAQWERSGDHMTSSLADAAKASSWGEWFARTLICWFGRWGMLVIDPLWPELRRLAAPLLVRMVREHVPVKEAVQQGAERVRALGQNPQVQRDDEHAHLFWVGDGLRRLLFRRGDLFGDATGRHRFTSSDLAEAIQRDPGCISPDVLLRPLLQDYLLPTITAVCGPGEIAYHAQLGPLYRTLGIVAPTVVRRVSVTLVEPWVRRRLQRRGLKPEDILLGGLEQVRGRLLAQADSIGLDALFGRARQAVREAYAPLREALPRVRPELQQLTDKNLERVMRELAWLQSRAREYHRDNQAQLLRDLEGVANHLLPGGHLQERVLSALPYVLKYGAGLLDELYGLIQEVGQDGHLLVTL